MACLTHDYDPQQVIFKAASFEIPAWIRIRAEQTNPEWVVEHATTQHASYRRQPSRHGVIEAEIHPEGLDALNRVRQIVGECFDVMVVDLSGTKESAIGINCRVEVQPPIERAGQGVSWPIRFLTTDLTFSPSTTTVPTDLVGSDV
jgi:hypothetical protein